MQPAVRSGQGRSSRPTQSLSLAGVEIEKYERLSRMRRDLDEEHSTQCREIIMTDMQHDENACAKSPSCAGPQLTTCECRRMSEMQSDPEQDDVQSRAEPGGDRNRDQSDVSNCSNVHHPRRDVLRDFSNFPRIHSTRHAVAEEWSLHGLIDSSEVCGSWTRRQLSLSNNQSLSMIFANFSWVDHFLICGHF